MIRTLFTRITRTYATPVLSRVPRRAHRLVLATGVAGAAVMLAASPAAAYGVTGTTAAGGGLNVRLDPNGAAGPISGGQIIATIPYDSTVYIDCTWPDAYETGPWGGTDVWDLIEGYTTPDGAYHDLTNYNGQAFVTDAWVNTGGDTSTMVSPCYGY